MELCDSDVTDHGLVFGQLTYDVYDVLEALVWTESFPISKFDSDQLWKQNFLEKRELYENKCYNCFGVICSDAWTSIYRPKLQINPSI